MVPVYWLTRYEDIYSHGTWDTRILDKLFAGQLWPHRWEFEHYYNVASIDEGVERAVVVLPARHHASAEDIEWLIAELGKLRAGILFLAGDEEGVFPWKRLIHDNIRFWVQHPGANYADMTDWPSGVTFYGCGSPIDFGEQPRPGFREMDWTFMGQVTHVRRRQAVTALRQAKLRADLRGDLLETDGFTRGMPQERYAQHLLQSKVVACPSGPATPDTFRFYEALEAGCYPIVDAYSPDARRGYWETVYGLDFPFPKMEDWDQVLGYIADAARAWPRSGNTATAWWIKQKRSMVKRLDADLRAIGCEPPEHHWSDDVTVVVTSSPTPNDPNTFLLDETIGSIVDSMGASPDLVLAFDGVRVEQAEMRDPYAAMIHEVCSRALSLPTAGILPLVAPRHLHQIRLTQLALEQVDTPLILFVEHDTPFTTDAIDWPAAVDAMTYGAFDVLRFHHEGMIQPGHEYLMIDHEPRQVYDLPVMRTRQWSSRPHLANADYYRRMLANLLTRPNVGFIEDTQHSVAMHEPTLNRIAIYAPEGSLCRTYHLDGRAGGPKFDDVLMP